MRYDRITGQFLTYEKGGEGSTQTVQTYSPEEAYRRSVLQAVAETLYMNTHGDIANAPYPGSAPVPASENTIKGQEGMLNTANQMQGNNQALIDAQKFGLGDVLYPESNPALRASIDAAIRPVTQAYTDTGGVMGQLRSDFGTADQYGSSRHNLASGIASGRYFDTIGDISTNRTQAAYDKGLDTMSRTMALGPQIAQTLFAPAGAYSAVGAQQESYEQAQRDYEANADIWKMNAPWAALQNYANIIYGGSSPGTTTMSQGPGGNKLMGALGGAAMGASLASMLGAGTGAAAGSLGGSVAAGAASGSVVPGWGTAIGAGIGLLVGMFAT